jgi:acetyl-CoA acetyltransferase
MLDVGYSRGAGFWRRRDRRHSVTNPMARMAFETAMGRAPAAVIFAASLGGHAFRTHRGVNGQGHPLSTTDVAQCVELFRQLRGAAVDHVDQAWIALAHNIDGSTAPSAVTIVEGLESNGR